MPGKIGKTGEIAKYLTTENKDHKALTDYGKPGKPLNHFATESTKITKTDRSWKTGETAKYPPSLKASAVAGLWRDKSAVAPKLWRDEMARQAANLKSSQMDWKNKTIRTKPGRTGKAGIGWWGEIPSGR